MEWLAGGVLKMVMGSIVGPLFNYLGKRQDVTLRKIEVDAGVTRDGVVALLQTDAIVKQATRDIILSAMTHPVWWVAWILFVLPVAAYEGSIFLVSAFDAHLNLAGCYIPEIGEDLRRIGHVCKYFVRRVPHEQETMARIIVQSIFLAQVGTGATAGIVSAIARRLKP